MELRILFLKVAFLFFICLGEGSWPVVATEFSSGDFVQISSDEQLVMELHSHGIGFTISMKATLGKIGKVKYVDSDGDLKVIICDKTWFYSAKAVTKLASAGDSGPEISSDCQRSQTTVNIKQRRVGDDLKLECTVDDISSSSSVRWVKDGVSIPRDSFSKSSNSRITASRDDPETCTLEIEDFEPEDAGWYTCEVTDGGDLVATGAVEVKVDQEDTTEEISSPHSETESTKEAAGGEFAAGDIVQVLSDEDTVKERFGSSLHFVHAMRPALGKIGIVKWQKSGKDIFTNICGTGWFYKPDTLIKLASAGNSTPELPSDCVWSDSTVSISEQRSGDSVILVCTVVNKHITSHVSWIKGGKHIARDSIKETEDPRITLHSSTLSERYMITIEDMKPEDAGWYTCEVTRDGKVAATAAIKLEVGQLPNVISSTTHPNTTSTTTTTTTTSTTTTEATVTGEKIVEGDIVWVLSDMEKVKELEEDHGGWTVEMKESLGKIGRVSAASDNNIRVQVCNTSWLYNPKALIKVASAGDSAPEISSNCVSSDARVSIKLTRVGKDVILDCKVLNKRYGSHVYWVNKYGQISEDSTHSVFNSVNHRLRVSQGASSQIFRLQISDIKSEDEGWYACEVRRHGLAATAVVKAEVWPETMEIETFYPETEKKPDASDEVFKRGDMVQVLSDEATVRERFVRLNFPDTMRETLGKIGRVIMQDRVKDVHTAICGTAWWYKPNTVIKLASASSSAPELSSDCLWSNSTVSISDQTSGNNVTLTCTVVHKPINSHVSWIKDGKVIARDSSRKIVGFPRFTYISNFITEYMTEYMIQIDDVKPEDSGWYTCEVTTNDKVAATAVVKLEVRQLPTPISTTTEPNTTTTTTTTSTTEATVTGDKFVEGDILWVLSDKAKVKKLAEHHGGWVDSMEKTLGKIGRVPSDYDGDIKVEVCNTSWIYNPKALIKLASAGDSTPEISSNCVTSNATTKITQERVGNIVKLICTVINEPSASSYISWAKEGVRISRDGFLQIGNPRIKVRPDYSSATYTLEFSNMKPEDGGWYTCELRNSDDKLAAVRAVKLVYQPNEEPTICDNCSELSSIKDQLLDIKYLITNATTELRQLHSKLNDVSERLEMVELRFFTSLGDAQAAA